jgi:hypothetical protein
MSLGRGAPPLWRDTSLDHVNDDTTVTTLRRAADAIERHFLDGHGIEVAGTYSSTS